MQKQKIFLKILFFIVIFFISTVANNLTAQDMRDVVYLKNGSIIKGIIIEQIPDISYKIETSDGSVFVCLYPDVEKIIKEKTELKQLQQPKTIVIREKNPAVACIASIILPGLGQVANEEYLKGLGFFLGCVGGIVLAISNVDELAAVGLLIYVGSYLGSVIDAPVSASSYNKKLLKGLDLGSVKFISLQPNLSVKQFGIGTAMTYNINLKLNF